MANRGVALIIAGALLVPVRGVGTEPLPPYVLLNLRGHAQQMPLSCESRSAVDLAAFWGVSVPEREFFDRLPKTDNPRTGFVGNVYEPWGRLPPNGYGVHAEPVAGLLRAYGLPSEVRYGLGLDGLRAELAAGRPVILWATPRMAAHPVETYTTSDGQKVGVVRYEHTVIAIGYTQWAVYVVDAGTGYRWAYNNQALLGAWGKLGQMSVVVYGNGNAPPVADAPPPVNATITFQSPSAGSTVRAPVEVRGTVQMAGFRYYEVRYGIGDAPAVWNWVSGPHPASVQDGIITPEQFTGFAPGRYTMRVVVYGAGERAEEQVRFTVVR
jgi:uncharacterized protein YvpB